MNKKTIAVDIDDVLADSTEVLRLFVNKKRGVSLEKHHYRFKTGMYWGYYESVWRQHDIDGDGIIDEFHEQYVADQSHVMPVNGAAEALALLHAKYKIIAVTSRSVDQQEATERWLKAVFGEVFDEVRCIDTRKNKELSKGMVCAQLGASVLIDDNVEHCLSAKQYNITPILFGEYGWHSDNVPEGITECKSWRDVLECLDEQTT